MNNIQRIFFHSKLDEISIYKCYTDWNRSCPIKKAKIKDIIVDRHSNKIESDASNWIREEGGDYFSAIRFQLEGGFELVIRYGGYDSTFIGFRNLPKTYLQEALQTVPLRLDPTGKLNDLLKVTKITPDELAQEAINVIERYAKAKYWAPTITSLLRIFYRHGMNCNYVSENGDTILSAISKLGPDSIDTKMAFLKLMKKQQASIPRRPF